MARTTSDDVIGILGDDYGPNRSGDLPDLTGRIATASVIIDRVITCATNKGYSITTTEAELLERWLAAHFYAVSDKPFQSHRTGDASATYSGKTAMKLDATLYGQQAKLIDPSGCLEGLDKRSVAKGVWLGRPPSEQTPYDERD